MAQRLQLKRSSINGKRPEGRYLEAGELALNTNGTNPGLFFEANDGSIVKVGPTVVTTNGEPPLLSNTLAEYNEGELWFDAIEGNLMVYANGKWTGTASDTGGSTPGCFKGDLVPCTTGEYNVGSSDLKWKEVHADTVNSGLVDSTTVSSTVVNSLGVTSTTINSDTIDSNTLTSTVVNSATAIATGVYADNVYTGDLHMKNDRGDWTTIEEEDFLSLRNNKTEKRYKIMMEEIPEG